MANNNKPGTLQKSNDGNDVSDLTPAQKTIDTPERITSYIEIVSKLFALFTWPVVLLIVVLMFYTPIRQMVELLPKKFASSSEISIGGLLSLKIQEEAKLLGNEELASIINGLSQEEIQKLITLGGERSHRLVGSNSDSSGVPQEYFLSLSDFLIWKKLGERGLVQSTSNMTEFEKFVYTLNPIKEENSDFLRFPVSSLTDVQKDKLRKNNVELTDTGKKAYDIIIKVIVDLIGE